MINKKAKEEATFAKKHGGRRPGAGRKEVSEPRITRSIKFTDSEWGIIKQKANKENKSASEYIRNKSLKF